MSGRTMHRRSQVAKPFSDHKIAPQRQTERSLAWGKALRETCFSLQPKPQNDRLARANLIRPPDPLTEHLLGTCAQLERVINQGIAAPSGSLSSIDR